MIQKPEIRIIRSRRRTVGLQIDENLVVTLRAPYRMSDAQIEKFIEEKSGWIETHLQKMREKAERTAAEQEAEGMITPEELKDLSDRARRYLPERVAY